MLSSIRQLLISQAPARKETKLAIMDYFQERGQLWEAYGSTEGGQGLVTLLRPEEAVQEAWAFHRERIFGTDRIKILDENGKRGPEGPGGRAVLKDAPYFKAYWKDPEKTKSVFQGEWFLCRGYGLPG